MLVLSLVTLLIASVSAFLSLNTQEEVVKVSTGFASVLSLFLTLIVAPWILKLSIVAIPLILDRLNSSSTKQSINSNNSIYQ